MANIQTLFGERIIKGARFSKDKKHRFALWRIWDEAKPVVMFIGLNPSKADGNADDPTIQSVERLSRFNGFGGFFMMNCFSFISTNPKHLVATQETYEQKLNDRFLILISAKCKEIVFAWGSFKIVRLFGRPSELAKMFPIAKCICKNNDGSPGHPLFKKEETKFINYDI